MTTLFEQRGGLYDKVQKVQRGVFYTPQPVVTFMVRAVDDLLRREFGLIDGLASTEKRKIKIKQQSKRKVNGLYKTVEIMEEVPAIQILDPATGTGTFLRQIIIQIYRNVREKYPNLSKEAFIEIWNEYVPEHMLPRVTGFELMMAPYAVAHPLSTHFYLHFHHYMVDYLLQHLFENSLFLSVNFEIKRRSRR